MNLMNEEMLGSVKSYSVVSSAIEAEFGVPPIRQYGGGARLAEVLQQVRTAVREEARRAAEEAVLRAFRVAAEHLPDDPEDGLCIPPTRILINSGAVGYIKTRPFNSITRSGV